jgi:hypothetical protein
MHSADAIEAINFEQLATATDRLLVRGRRAAKRWPGESPRSAPPSLAYADTVPARVSYALPTLRTLPARAVHADLERTVIVRSSQASNTQVFAITVVIPALVGIAVGLAAML